jgi:hypothetical protein
MGVLEDEKKICSEKKCLALKQEVFDQVEAGRAWRETTLQSRRFPP